MALLETAAATAAKSITEHAFKEWLIAQDATTERTKPMVELIRISFPDRLVRRKLERQIAEIVDSVDRRLSYLIQTEYRGLAKNDRAAVLQEVVDSISKADLSDQAFFALDADPIRLAQKIEQNLSPAHRYLGEAGERLFSLLLAESCECIVRVIIQLPAFAERGTVEQLSRLSGIGERTAEILDRLPLRTLDAPDGDQDDNEFERRYLEYLSATLDEIELFGVPSISYRPKATLSVSYISLSIAQEDSRRRLGPNRVLGYSELTGEGKRADLTTTKVETALGECQRTLLRGEAGSGKTTLLRWIAVSAARGSFVGDLKNWNGLVPFLVTLRRHPEGPLPTADDLLGDTAAHLRDHAPRGWVHRILKSGRGILLIDGVDELPERRRLAVRQWLKEILTLYPGQNIVVTSRPAAIDNRWLSAEKFSSVILTPMTPSDLRELVKQWHDAIRDRNDLPCPSESIVKYERALLARFEANAHLRNLAVTPLLAAMLCALNLDRASHLPRNRMGIYDAVLEMLLERRDAGRDIPSFQEVDLDRQQKEHILRGLAWYVSICGRSEIAKEVAVKKVDEIIAGMPRVEIGSRQILDYLLLRSGVIREPVPGRIDFVHRTVQEYLTASQIADSHDIDLLISRAHVDQWQETLIMAVGHANAKLRAELLQGLLDRAQEESRNSRRLRIVVAACMETISEIPVSLRDRIEGCLSTLVPPRSRGEAESLARAGEEVLRHFPDRIDALTEAQAVAVVRACWLINGPKALRKLEGYGGDNRLEVQDELILGWRYFEPVDYAQRVLSETPFISEVPIFSAQTVPAIRFLRKLTSLYVEVREEGVDLNFLRDMTPLEALSVWVVRVKSLDAIGAQASLTFLRLLANDDELGFLTRLPRLAQLHVVARSRFRNLAFLGNVASLESLGLGGLQSLNDYSPIRGLVGLKRLELFLCFNLTHLEQVGEHPDLEELTLSGAGLTHGIAEIAARFPKLHTLNLVRAAWATDVEQLAKLKLKRLLMPLSDDSTQLDALRQIETLEELRLHGGSRGVPDIGCLSSLKHLETLDLSDCSALPELSSVAKLENLRYLILPPNCNIKGISALGNRLRVLHSPPGVFRTVGLRR